MMNTCEEILASVVESGLSEMTLNSSKELLLEDCVVDKSCTLDESNGYTLHINGNVMIECRIPIVASKKAIIKGVPGSRLVLKATEMQQPCIGPATNTNLSYGRWEPSSYLLESITVDGVEVVCESRTKNFAIGSYGRSEVPNVTLLNGGKLICPEMTGKRVVTHHAVAPEGSTKISEDMGYAILKEGEVIRDLFSEDKKALCLELERVNPSMLSCVGLTTPESVIRGVIELSKMKPGIDCTRYIEMSEYGKAYIGRSADVLQMPADRKIPASEFLFESGKAEYISKQFYGSDGSELDVNAKTIISFFIKEVKDLSDYMVEVLYEIIPSYCYSYPKGLSHEEMIYDFVESSECELDMEMYSRLIEHKDELVRRWCVPD